jgi:GNAT superfamily N-acetyltransferase
VPGGLDGELHAIYVAERYQGQGLGRALVASVAADLLGSGANSMLVWVLAGNPFRAFYERLGGVPLAERRVELGGAVLAEVAFGWSNVASLASD